MTNAHPASAPSSEVTSTVFDCIAHQERVKSYFEACARDNKLSHAYLFSGTADTDMHAAARALAQLLVCPQHGCGHCHDCSWVLKDTHPDVHHISPEGSSGYLVDQLRDLIADVSLRPVRSQAKVYIIEKVELLFAASANALLKTLEEPPEATTFILLTNNRESVLSTIVSRCQIVPFRPLNADEALGSLMSATNASESDARLAFELTHDYLRAQEFLESSARQYALKLMLTNLAQLPRMSSWEIIKSAVQLCKLAQVPVEELKGVQEEQRRESEEYLFRQGTKRLEERHKRELSQSERSGMIELIHAAQIFLRDVLMITTGAASSVVLDSFEQHSTQLAHSSSLSGILAALEACEQAHDDIARNITPQLVIETMLITIKEALTCPPLSR
ncbi:MAG: DNA polymerase III subunit delta' [Atopobiaceae bacterium]|nr:DNA polymerase III subunit delta' [Atopobiaceae bacterium]